MDSQFISLQQAIEMTTLYRAQKDIILKEEFKGRDILAISETFETNSISAVLGEEGCTAVRIYFGMDVDLKIHSIIVGVNDKNEDILSSSGMNLTSTGTVILENATRCPPTCPPPAPK